MLFDCPYLMLSPFSLPLLVLLLLLQFMPLNHLSVSLYLSPLSAAAFGSLFLSLFVISAVFVFLG